MTQVESVTLQEARFVVDRSIVDINKAIEHGEVEPTVISVAASPKKLVRADKTGSGGLRRRGRSQVAGFELPKMQKVRTLGEGELVYLALGREVQESLTPATRRKLAKAIVAAPEKAAKVNVGPIQVQLKEARAKVVKRYRALKDIRTGILERPGEEPVFKGTEIEVYRVAAVAQGQGIDKAIADYPSLKPKQVQRALDYSQAYPKRGRPYPTRGFKDALGELAESGLFDLPVHGEDSAQG